MTTKRHNPATYTLAIVTHQRHSLFQRPANAELMVDMLFRYRDQRSFVLHAFVVMPDHIHALITPADDHATSRCVQLIKGGFSFAVRDQFKGEVWSTGYHEHRIRDPHDFVAQKLYIANNPSRKQHRNYPFVHTNYESRIDPMPLYLTGTNGGVPQGVKPTVSTLEIAEAEASAYLEAHPHNAGQTPGSSGSRSRRSEEARPT